MNLYIFEANKNNQYTYGVICVISDSILEAIEMAKKGGVDSFDTHFTVYDNGDDSGWHVAKIFELKDKDEYQYGKVYENWDNC